MLLTDKHLFNISMNIRLLLVDRLLPKNLSLDVQSESD